MEHTPGRPNLRKESLMKHCLLLLGVIAALAIGAPAYSQYIYMDLNGDQVCTSADALTSSITAVDVWLDTNHNKDGTTATCVDPSKPLDIFSYGVLIHSQGSGTVTFNSWTNAAPNFALLINFRAAGPDMGVGYQLQPPGAVDPPGKYKLGTVNVAVTGAQTWTFLTDAPDLPFVDGTGFGADCPASVSGNTETHGHGVCDNCGTAGRSLRLHT